MSPTKMIHVIGEKSVGRVKTLAGRIWREHYTPIIGRGQVEYMLGKYQSKKAVSEQIAEGYFYYLIEDPKGLVGYIAYRFQERELFISKFYVAKERRGRGFGRYAMEFVEKAAREKGKSKIVLTVNKKNTNSIKAYKKYGFRIVRPVVQDIGGGFVMDDYRMEKKVV